MAVSYVYQTYTRCRNHTW